MFSFKSIYFVIFILIWCESEALISDKRECVNENCTELVSIGKTLIRYSSPEKYVLSFAPNQHVNVFSYGAGSRPELIGVEINGRRGYMNKNHLRETRLFNRPKILVDTEIVENKSQNVLKNVPDIKPDPTQQPYEIVDGTRILLDLDSSSTETPEVITQSADKYTQPLVSIPNNQNDKSAIKSEPNIVRATENANLNQQELQLEKKVNEDDEEDDAEEVDAEDDDVDNDDDNEDNEEQALKDNTDESNNESTQKIVEKTNSDAEEFKSSSESGKIQVKDKSDHTSKTSDTITPISNEIKENKVEPVLGVVMATPEKDLSNSSTDKTVEQDNIKEELRENFVEKKPVNEIKEEKVEPVLEVVMANPEKDLSDSSINKTVEQDNIKEELRENFVEKKPVNEIKEEKVEPVLGGVMATPEKDLSNSSINKTVEQDNIKEELRENFVEKKPVNEIKEEKVEPVLGGVMATPEKDLSNSSTNQIIEQDITKEELRENLGETNPVPLMHPYEDLKQKQNFKYPSLPPTTTEAPLPPEILSPILDEVTPNPLNDQSTVLSSDIQNVNLTEDVLPIITDLPVFSETPDPLNNQHAVLNSTSEDIKQKTEDILPASTDSPAVSETPDPLNIQHAVLNSTSEDIKQATEDILSASTELPASSEFNDQEKVEIKSKEKIDGVFGSLFNVADDRQAFDTVAVPVRKEIHPPGEFSSLSVTSNPSNEIVNSDESAKEHVEAKSLIENVIPEAVQSEQSASQNLDQLANTYPQTSSQEEEATEGFFTKFVRSIFEYGKSEGTDENNNGPVDGSVRLEGKESEGVAVVSGSLPNYKEPSGQEEINENMFDTFPFNSREEISTTNNQFCKKGSEDCPLPQDSANTDVQNEKLISSNYSGSEDLQFLLMEAVSSDLFLYLSTTALSVMVLLFGMVLLDKCRRERPLIGRINKLEQQLLTTMKENEMLQEKVLCEDQRSLMVADTVPNEVVEELNQKLEELTRAKQSLEEQVQALEKELDTSTEVGIELNKIISEMLNSSDGSEFIKENIEQMQKKLLEQQDVLNSVNETLSLKETENHELRLEMDISNKKVVDLQNELDKMVEKILKIEEERDQQHSALETEILACQTQYKEALSKEFSLSSEIQALKQEVTKFQRIAEVKVKEYNSLKESLSELKLAKNNKDVLKSLVDVSAVRAELEQLKAENLKYAEDLAKERDANGAYASKLESLSQELDDLKEKYMKADKEKVEIGTKLQVLNNYFKEKEEQMQKELSKYESLWAAKEGEATSTTERIRHMQEELQNCKAQNESLKQEIMNQEVELKSQISMLEKKAHESWVTNRQTERKLEEARQEAAQLRNRLTLRERALAEGNNQTRMQPPLHQNGELPAVSPPPLGPTQSPPPIFNPRDHMTKSPPMPGMPPHPFLPPPLGATPFIPPPPLDGMMPPIGDMGGMPPPFMPPLPPGMFPGDHRPPPLGRMSSPPPVGGRYTPESTIYSDYDRYSRRSPSPPYDSEYGASPPPIRGYSPYHDRLRDDRREYQRPQARSNGRSSKGVHSSASDNDSLGKVNKKPQRNV